MFNVSCIQLTSDNNVFSNLEKTTDLIIGSIKKKADLIITPENTSLFTFDHSELLEKAEEMNNNFFLESVSRISKSYKKWILIGSLPIKLSKNGYSCGSGDSFVTSNIEMDVDVVDMEAYAIAKICKKENIKFRCFKFISDEANENAKIDWIENCRKGAALFSEHAKKIALI